MGLSAFIGVHRRLQIVVMLAIAAAAAAGPAAGARAYPSRPVRAIVGFVPGGSTDLIARQLAQKLSESLGQPVIVDNRPSGAGVMAAVMAKDAPADGHTLYFGTISALATHVATHAKLPYDPMRDYAPITMTLSNPYFLAVHPGMPAGSVKEFIALARARPGQLNYSTSGTGGGAHLGIELLPLIAGLGIAGAGIALAMQGVLGNAVAGLTIIFSRPFRVGDYISIVKEEGEVLEIKLFNTTLGHPDLSHVVIPNRKIVGEILHNYGTMRQLALDVTVTHDADVRAAEAAIGEVLRGNPRVLQKPAPAVAVRRLTENGVQIGVGPWVQVTDYVAAMGEINQAMLEALRRRGIAVAVPQRG